MSILNALERLSYHLAGPHRRLFYNTLCACIEKEEFLKDEIAMARLYAMKMYCQASDGLVTEAVEIFENHLRNRTRMIKDYKIESIMLKDGLLRSNLVEEIDVEMLKSIDKYEVLLLKNCFEECRKCAISILKDFPMCSMVVVLLEGEFTSNIKIETVKLLLKRVSVSSSLISLLYTKGFPYEILIPYAKKQKKDVSFLFLMKTLLIGGESLSEYSYNIDTLLQELDDWEIYQYAIEKSIKIKERKESINGLRHLMVTSPTVDSICKFITSSNFVEHALEYIKYLSNEDTQQLLNGLSRPVIVKIEYYLKNRVSVFDKTIKECLENVNDFVFLIGVLLAERTEQSLIDCLLLCFIKKEFYQSTYQVRLLLCVLYRYLFLYDLMIDEYIKLSVDLVQLEGMTYLWSDLQILLEEDSPFLETQYIKNRLSSLGQVNANLISFIENEEYTQIEPLLEYRNILINSAIYKQIVEKTLYPLDRPPAIRKTLIEESTYVFDKLLKEPEINENSTVLTIHNRPAHMQKEKLENLFTQSFNRIKEHIELPHEIHTLKSQILEGQETAWQRLSSNPATRQEDRNVIDT